MNTFLLILIGVIGIIFGYALARGDVRERLDTLVNEERHLVKERKKAMLMKHLRDRGQLTNEDAQELLGVSESTVTRYFDELEEAGLVEQKGHSGRGVYYELSE